LQTISTGTDQLRGYPSGAFGGTGLVLGNVELRFPIARPGSGRGTWPLFLRRVHGALFFDAGETFDLRGQVRFAGHAFDARRLLLAAGAELRLEVVLGYYLRTDVRIGFARSLGPLGGRTEEERVPETDPGSSWFVTVGPSF
jgi:outer membrane protein assembly factor BamA